MLKINKPLIENIISLFTVKGLEYILAFITFPYLVRVLEVERFGAIVFVQGIMQYFILFTDYGFNLLGPREIARHDDTFHRGQIFSSIIIAKLILLFISTVILAVGIVVISSISYIDTVLYWITYLMVIGNVLFPIWFFQGIQKMRYITIVNIIARSATTIGIFILVKEPSDYLLAAFFQSIGTIIAAICSWWILFKNYKEVFVLSGYRSLKEIFKKGWDIFISTIAINLYTASNIVFLGIMTNNTVVGYFSGAQKIIMNIMMLFNPIIQAIYPHISKMASQSKADTLKFLHKILLILGGGSFIVSISILIFADIIVRILFGTGYEESIFLLRIMAFLPFIIMLSNIFGVQTMLIFGMQKAFSRILIGSAIINTVIVFPLIYFYENIGVSISMNITEVFVTLSMFFILKKNNINLLSENFFDR